MRVELMTLESIRNHATLQSFTTIVVSYTVRTARPTSLREHVYNSHRTSPVLRSQSSAESSQASATEDVLYRRVHVPARRKQRTHVLRRVREAHILQLLWSRRSQHTCRNRCTQRTINSPGAAPGTVPPGAWHLQALEGLRTHQVRHPTQTDSRTGSHQPLPLPRHLSLSLHRHRPALRASAASSRDRTFRQVGAAGTPHQFPQQHLPQPQAYQSPVRLYQSLSLRLWEPHPLVVGRGRTD